MQQILYPLAVLLAAIGAINWGIIGLFRHNPIRRFLASRPGAESALYTTIGIAGSWLALSSALSAIRSLFGRRGPRPTRVLEGRSMVGRMLPSFGGSTLSGKRVTFPLDTHGKMACLVLGFTYDSRWNVENWAEAFRDRFGETRGVDYYQVAVMESPYRLLSPVIHAGMRRETPPEMLDHVVTLFASQGPFREALRASPNEDTWVYLLDKDGRVLFQCGGPFEEHTFEEMARLVEYPILKGKTKAPVFR